MAKEPNDSANVSSMTSGSRSAGPLGPLDLHLFAEGRHYRLWERLGAHPEVHEGERGTRFAVWAPGARRVSVMGDFNEWDKNAWNMRPVGGSGIWETFVPDVGAGSVYKFHIESHHNQYCVDKADPVGFMAEEAPETASVVWPLEYNWGDADWMSSRGGRRSNKAPMSVYEVHLGSWMRVPEQGNRHMTYREMAPRLAHYVKEMGFTHVEIMPVMEHPLYRSWGYLVDGYYAPTSRYGTPQDFMYLVDILHRNGIGVILDWVPSHYPRDEHGLGFFDGTHLYEHADPRKGFHPDWGSFIFNYGRNEVRSFLISNALYWMEMYHVDAMRVDAVASMLYLDYSRRDGEWLPNQYGGRENLEAIAFLRELNDAVARHQPDCEMIAEESTAWPMVSHPTREGGLGFSLKWDMGWMHDTLKYMALDPVYRRSHQDDLAFRQVYAFHEKFVLSLSHDEVVHGKGSIVRKMPGDDWQRFANVRLLYAYMYALPGKKLLFMGNEFAQWNEWYHDVSLDWHLLERAEHAGVKRLVGDLNRLYSAETALYQDEFKSSCFEWIDHADADRSVFSFLRRDASDDNQLVCVFNFTPVTREFYPVGVPRVGTWHEVFNSDAAVYGGSGAGNMGRVEAKPMPMHGRPASLCVTLPPLGAVFFRKSKFL